MPSDTAQPVDALLVEYSQAFDQITVKLHEDVHYDMFKKYSKLPSIIRYRGRLYRKTGWNSDHGEAYYLAATSNHVAWPE